MQTKKTARSFFAYEFSQFILRAHIGTSFLFVTLTIPSQLPKSNTCFTLNLVFSGTGNDGYDLTNDAYPDLGTSEDTPDYDPETGEVLSLNDNEETF